MIDETSISRTCNGLLANVVVWLKNHKDFAANRSSFQKYIFRKTDEKREDFSLRQRRLSWGWKCKTLMASSLLIKVMIQALISSSFWGTMNNAVNEGRLQSHNSLKNRKSGWNQSNECREIVLTTWFCRKHKYLIKWQTIKQSNKLS